MEPTCANKGTHEEFISKTRTAYAPRYPRNNQTWAQDLSGPSPTEDIEMAMKHLKRRLASVLELRIRSAMGHHLTQVRKVIIEKLQQSVLESKWRKRIHNGEQHKGSWKTEQRSTTGHSNPTPGADPEKTVIVKDRCTPVFMAVLCTIAKTWMKPKWVRTDEWVPKMGYTHRAMSLSHKKGDITPRPATRKEVETSH